MDQELLSFEKVNPGSIDDIWSFDASQLESTSTPTLTQYIMKLAQWLVYYKSQTNAVRSELSTLQSDMDVALHVAITADLVKEHKTKTAATAYLITTDKDVVGPLHEKIRLLKKELTRVDGMDKPVTEYINSFKRELDRRKHEQEVARMERKI